MRTIAEIREVAKRIERNGELAIAYLNGEDYRTACKHLNNASIYLTAFLAHEMESDWLLVLDSLDAATTYTSKRTVA
jgi:hypothetical protein